MTTLIMRLLELALGVKIEKVWDDVAERLELALGVKPHHPTRLPGW